MLMEMAVSKAKSTGRKLHYGIPTEKCFQPQVAFFYLLSRNPGAFHFVALPSPRDSKSFVSGQWKQREHLCSEVTHIAIRYIPWGRMSPRAPLGRQGSWAEDALAGQTSLSDCATLG